MTIRKRKRNITEDQQRKREAAEALRRQNQIKSFQSAAIKLSTADDSIIPELGPLLPFLEQFFEKLRNTRHPAVQSPNNNNETHTPSFQITTSAELSTAASTISSETDSPSTVAEEEKVHALQFWLKILVDLGNIEHTWESFSTPSAIKAHFQQYGPKAQYLLASDDIEKNSSKDPADVIASKKIGRTFTGVSLAKDLKRWMNEHPEDEDPIDSFVKFAVCELPPDAELPPKCENDVIRLKASLKRGIMINTAQNVSNNPAIAILLGWIPWVFEHLVGRSDRKIRVCIAVLEGDPRFRVISKLLNEWREQFNTVQQMIENLYRGCAKRNTAESRGKFS
jgi:hypothetical protein